MLCACYCAMFQFAFLTYYSIQYMLLRVLKNSGATKKLQATRFIKATCTTALPAPATAEVADDDATTAPELVYQPPSTMRRLLTRWRLFWLMPWYRFSWGSVLEIKLSGKMPETAAHIQSPTLSLTEVCTSIWCAAHDPRIPGIYLKLSGLKMGWAKLQEVRRHMAAFRQSGKFIVAYVERGGEKEYYLASACTRVYVPPTGQLHLRGFWMAGTFVRGLLDNAGIEPQVVRCGEYKSAADQLTRIDMGPHQREALQALVQDTRDVFAEAVAESRGKTRDDVIAMLDEGVFDMQALARGGWVDGCEYEGQVLQQVAALAAAPIRGKQDPREGGDGEGVLSTVPLQFYYATPPSMFGLGGCLGGSGRRCIALIHASGMIVGGPGGIPGLQSVSSGDVIAQLRSAKRRPGVAAVVLRVDSPGGDALASDLMWKEVQELSAVKPVVASMSDVAGSGGYYLAMAAGAGVVAEPLTITGSIGVVSGKFNLGDLYSRVGYAKEVVSEGRFSELIADHRAFTQEEQQLFTQMAEHSYITFRSKAASNRRMSEEEMEKVARGRIWSGRRALQVGLVDAVGGINRAVMMAKRAAGIAPGQQVGLVDMSQTWVARALRCAVLAQQAASSAACASPAWRAMAALAAAPGELCATLASLVGVVGGKGVGFGGGGAGAVSAREVVALAAALAQAAGEAPAGQALLQYAALAADAGSGSGGGGLAPSGHFHACLMPQLG